MVTQSLMPSKLRALPYLPVVVQVASRMVPVWPLPVTSVSGGAGAVLEARRRRPATGPVGALLSTVTVTVAAVVRLPARVAGDGGQRVRPGAAAGAVPVDRVGRARVLAAEAAPSSWNCTPATPTSSDALAVTDTAPRTVAPAAGARHRHRRRRRVGQRVARDLGRRRARVAGRVLGDHPVVVRARRRPGVGVRRCRSCRRRSACAALGVKPDVVERCTT